VPSFAYKAMTESGSVVSGTIEAAGIEQAQMAMAQQGLIPTKVSLKGGGAGAGLKARLSQLAMKKPKASDLILFTKQFKTMFQAGLTVVSLLEVLEQQTENPSLKQAVQSIVQDIRRGGSLHESFARHPRIFSRLYTSMIAAGERSGSLTEVMERMIYIIEHEFKVRKDIQSALTYPVIVIVMLFLAFIFLLTFVIPKFVAIFAHANIEMPLPTRINIFLYEFLKSNWHFLILGTVGFFMAVGWYVRTDQGRLLKDRLVLRLPVIGKVLQKAAMSRFASIFAILQSSGVSVLESVRIISGIIGNAAIALEFDNLREKLEEGRGISGPLRSSSYFTPMIITMIAIGEESGNLETMLHEVAVHYDYEVSYSITKMSELIGPAMMVGLAGVVGFFALSIFLPLFELIKAV
jgi:type IV pilus assembly protein PilC